MFLGSQNRRIGGLWGRLGAALGGSWGDFGGSEGGRGRPPAAQKKKHLVRFKIMKLCGGFSLLLKRLEIDLNEFFDDIFSESGFIRFFRVLYIHENFGIFFPMNFTIKKSFLR